MADEIIDEVEDIIEAEMPVDELDDGEDEITEIPIHGVLAPEGVPTGDGRMFAKGALVARDLPVPLRHEILSSHGGDTSHVVTVGRVDSVFREGNMMRYKGAIVVNKPYASDVIDGIIDGTVRGVSVDGDDAVIEEGMSEDNVTTFRQLRVAALTIVPIPAFQEAYIALGDEFQEDLTEQEIADQEALIADCGCGGDDEDENPDIELGNNAFRDYSDEERQRLAEEGKALPDGSYPIVDEEDLRNAIQAIGRAKDPARTRAHIKKRARELDLEDLIPEHWSAEEEALTADATFAPGTKDGPGWITHPVPTARIRRYWTRGPGAAKIRWGVPGDFNRCRNQLRKYIANPDWLAGTCANMHREALGVWPGRESTSGGTDAFSALPPDAGKPAPAVTLVASARDGYPSEWFADPQLTSATPLTVDRETGRVWGHIAAWGVCHIGIPGVCTTAPQSFTDYSAFKTGVVETDGGPVRVGKLTSGVGHPSPSLRAAQATAHYDKTDAVRAYVNVGEDSHGIWFAGVLSPGLSDEQIDEFQAVGSLSGDWREVGGNLELVAAVSVNTPGFPIPALAASGGIQTSLVAAGVVRGGLDAENLEGIKLDTSEMAKDLYRNIREIEARADRRAEMDSKIKAHRVGVARRRLQRKGN